MRGGEDGHRHDKSGQPRCTNDPHGSSNRRKSAGDADPQRGERVRIEAARDRLFDPPGQMEGREPSAERQRWVTTTSRRHTRKHRSRWDLRSFALRGRIFEPNRQGWRKIEKSISQLLAETLGPLAGIARVQPLTKVADLRGATGGLDVVQHVSNH